MSIIYVNQSSGRKRKSSSKKLAKAKEEHAQFLKSMGYTKGKRKAINEFPDLSVKIAIPTSNNIHVNGGFKRSVDDYKWRSGRSETQETIDAIEQKKKQIVIPYNKGPTMLLTKSDDLKTIGRKV